MDLGEGRALQADHYCLRNDNHHYDCPLRHWELQGSNDGQAWTTLRQHANDASLEEVPMSVAAWPIEQTGNSIAYRHFRILATGRNSGGTKHLLCAGIELYGKLKQA